MLAKYQGMIDGQQSYQKKVLAWQNNVDTLSAGFQRAIRDYEHKSVSMSSKEKQLSQQLLASKQKQFADYQRAVQNNAKQEEAQYNQKIISSVNAFLARYGKQHNYDVILIASQTGTIAYARPGLDLTEEVIAELNNEYIKSKSR